MRINNPHIIEKVAFELRMPDRSVAFELQQDLSHWFREEATPALEQLFDEIIPADHVVQLDQLSLDLGDLKSAQLINNLTEELIEQVKEALQEQIPPSGQQNSDIGQQSIPAYTFAHWLHFLEKGYWPRTSVAETSGDTFWASIYQQLERHPSAQQQLRQLLQQSAITQKRLIHNSTTRQQAKLLSILSGKNQQALVAIWNTLQKWLTESATPQNDLLKANFKSILSTNQWNTLVWQYSWAQGLRQQASWVQIVVNFLQEVWQVSPTSTELQQKTAPSLDWPEQLQLIRQVWEKLGQTPYTTEPEKEIKTEKRISDTD
ncbi:MAG: contractile injection system tape measure protein, partial [Bacteroidota bacterium]